MRTTIDLPDDLVRQAKATAALRGISLKDYFHEIVTRALEKQPLTSGFGHKEPLPATVMLPGGQIKAMTNAEIDEMFVREDIEKYGHD